MEHLAVRNKITNKLSYQSRKDREAGISICIKHGLKVSSLIEKVFDNRNEAERYCQKLNDVNNIIDDL